VSNELISAMETSILIVPVPPDAEARNEYKDIYETDDQSPATSPIDDGGEANSEVQQLEKSPVICMHHHCPALITS
jgi:hypothetical protein